ncbi:MAG: hypothetical protein DRJ31_06495 [Candidatus Methanomethylicota archaeon]|uniref:Nucleoside-triphosphatase DRJ31_06495 n=1 Tax=Thermoproteota archaeon TaxID=2056631 RepID=A0A497EPB2_9CREN|nr:MAG: hypothetical protein DRJ31_06495 [Candidatus Verstraetearchaeota archaeon]RLE52881.1 MAG: hypothetical protein DRJ33_02545 [Candidatus Verstraetearchaeota archaeon]
MKVLITGKPGIGKTTVFMKAIEKLKQMGFKVGGMMCPEVRTGFEREGFKVIDLESKKEGWLASKKFKVGPRIGRYIVNVHDLENIGVEAVRKALSEADIVAVDEVGPMELKSKAFEKIIDDLLNSEKKALIVVHWKLKDVYAQKAFGKATVFEVTLENREYLPEVVVEHVIR